MRYGEVTKMWAITVGAGPNGRTHNATNNIWPILRLHTVAALPSVQMAAVANQQQPFMFQQQQTMMMVSQQQHPVNPFGNRYTASVHPYERVPVQPYNPYMGLI